MHITSITSSTTALPKPKSASIHLEKLSDGIAMSISFLDKGRVELSKVNFEMRPVTRPSGGNMTAFFQEIMDMNVYQIADVFPLNGVIKKEPFNMKNFVREHHRNEIEANIHKLNALEKLNAFEKLGEVERLNGLKALNAFEKLDDTEKLSAFETLDHFEKLDLFERLNAFEKLNGKDDKREFVRLMVIDFKDSSITYSDRDEISENEASFAKFLKEPLSKKASPAQAAAHRVIRESSRINFIINEGTLKADLLKNTFKDQQRAFFQKQKNYALFCQLCELMMNAFKQGQEVVVDSYQYLPNDYIVSLSSSVSSLVIDKKNLPVSPVLQTYYPKVYKETYSNKSEYYNIIKNISEVSYHNDDKEITTITVR